MNNEIRWRARLFASALIIREFLRPQPRDLFSLFGQSRVILTATRNPLLFRRCILPLVARAILRCFAEPKIEPKKTPIRAPAATQMMVVEQSGYEGHIQHRR